MYRAHQLQRHGTVRLMIDKVYVSDVFYFLLYKMLLSFSFLFLYVFVSSNRSFFPKVFIV